MRLLAVVVGIAAIAVCNALVVPLLLEREIERHWKSPLMRRTLDAGIPGGEDGLWTIEGFAGSQLSGYSSAYRAKGCQNMALFQRCLSTQTLSLVMVFRRPAPCPPSLHVPTRHSVQAQRQSRAACSHHRCLCL